MKRGNATRSRIFRDWREGISPGQFRNRNFQIIIQEKLLYFAEKRIVHGGFDWQLFIDIGQNRLACVNCWFNCYSPTFHYGFLITSYNHAIFPSR